PASPGRAGRARTAGQAEGGEDEEAARAHAVESSAWLRGPRLVQDRLEVGERGSERTAGAALELAGAFAREAQVLAHLDQGERFVLHQALLDDVALARVEAGHRRAHALGDHPPLLVLAQLDL